MNKFATLFLALVSVVFFGIQSASADSFVVRCPQQSQNFKIYKAALEAKVKASIDPALYTEPRVRVLLRLISIDTPPSSNSVDNILNGLQILPGGTPTGLTFSASGASQYLTQCRYTYRVSIRASGRNTSTKLKETAETESFIQLLGTAVNGAQSRE